MAERLKSFRIWQRVTLFAWWLPSIQRRLDIYREWFNAERPIYGPGCRTPDELALSEATGVAESKGLWAGADSLAGPRASRPHPVGRAPKADEGGRDGRAPFPLRENDPVKPALDVHRLHYRGDPNLIQIDIRIVRSVKRSA